MTGIIVAHATKYEFQVEAVFQGKPMDSADIYDHRAITVEWRGGATWAIVRGSEVWCDGSGEWEPSPSNREDDFLSRTRYTKAMALHLAVRLANPNWPNEPATSGRSTGGE